MSTLNPEQLANLQIELAKRKLIHFTTYTKPDYQVNWHHKLLADKLDELLDGKIKKLIVSMPPRHGKSELVSRRLPPYALGIEPNLSIIACSYSMDLASRMNRDVQRIIESPKYSNVFPGTKLNEKNIKSDSNIAYLRNSSIFEVVGHKGMYRSTGVGGGITGMGADLCFVKNTTVMTVNGYRLIQDVKVNDWVYCYDEKRKQIGRQRVTNVLSRSCTGLFKINTSKGREILCTPEHPFYVKGQGYIEAKDLKGSEELVEARVSESQDDVFYIGMLKMWGSFLEEESGLRKIYKKGLQKGTLLFYSMLKTASLNKEQKKMRDLFFTNREKNKKILQRLQAGSLLKNKKEILEKLQGYSSDYSIPRWFCLLYLQYKKEFGCSSHRSRPYKQQDNKLDDNVQELPYFSPRQSTEIVTGVENLRDIQATVCDITVRSAHNFFADGILVHNCIIDDPIKDMKEASSITVRNSIWDWYTSTLSTRLEKSGAILITMTRWHKDDLVGRVLDIDNGFEVLELPAISEDNNALWPDKYDIDSLNEIKRNVGSKVFSSLYQQSPTIDGGSLIKQDWLKFYDHEINTAHDFIMSWDMAFKGSDTSDYVVGQVWAKQPITAAYYLVDQVRGKWDFPATIDNFIKFTKKWPHATKKVVESKANGQAVIDTLKKHIEGIVPYSPRDSKESRLNSIAPLFEAGNIYLPRHKDFTNDFVEELTNFPYHKHDDQVDACAQALINFKSSQAAFAFVKSNNVLPFIN